MNYSGSIKVYVGPMFSGKTSAILDDYVRYSIGKKKCLFVKYCQDNRYKDSYTHDKKYQFVINSSDNKCLPNGLKFNEISCAHLYEIDNIVNNFDVVVIDEIQFFEDNYIFCEKWANQGLIIRAAGLISTYERKIFEGMEKLLPKAEEIEFKYAVCEDNGRNAEFTSRTINENNVILIGGKEAYKPTDRINYFSLMSDEKKFTYLLEQFDYFKIIYQNANNIEITVNCSELENYIMNLVNSNENNFNFLDILLKFKIIEVPTIEVSNIKNC